MKELTKEQVKFIKSRYKNVRLHLEKPFITSEWEDHYVIGFKWTIWAKLYAVVCFPIFFVIYAVRGIYLGMVELLQDISRPFNDNRTSARIRMNKS